MRLLLLILFSLAFTLISSQVLGNGYRPGFVVLISGDTLVGDVKYRRIDVPRKVFFKNKTGETTFNPRELKSFKREGEMWYAVHFTTVQLGWDDDFFLKRHGTKKSLRLLYGKITSKGCGCHGVPYSVSKEWVLYNENTGASVIIERSFWGHVKNDAWVLAILDDAGWSTSDMIIGSFKDLRTLISSSDS